MKQRLGRHSTTASMATHSLCLQYKKHWLITVYSLPQHILSTPTYTVYSNIYCLLHNILSAPTGTVHSTIYGLPQHILSTPTYTVCSNIYCLLQHILSAPTGIIYSNIYYSVPYRYKSFRILHNKLHACYKLCKIF